ncbi:hypothetical protein Mapa_008550 [Marchantia paleacea]|nr:hypothetical protein Mapa_008550 [Marchantia paleacea]
MSFLSTSFGRWKLSVNKGSGVYGPCSIFISIMGQAFPCKVTEKTNEVFASQIFYRYPINRQTKNPSIEIPDL